MTNYHDYNLPSKGSTEWHKPLNRNFREIDNDVEIRDTEANLNQYKSQAGAKFLATDSGRTYVGTSDGWEQISSAGAAETPHIVCYEAGNTGYAETATNTYSGNDIFQAAQ